MHTAEYGMSNTYNLLTGPHKELYYELCIEVAKGVFQIIVLCNCSMSLILKTACGA